MLRFRFYVALASALLATIVSWTLNAAFGLPSWQPEAAVGTLLLVVYAMAIYGVLAQLMNSD